MLPFIIFFYKHILKILGASPSVADPDPFDADPDPFDTDTDPACHFDRIRILTVSKR
jgi:hypothetical protein